jgi:cyclophilin family peptidyl-prolyl cis-trans isomerase
MKRILISMMVVLTVSFSAVADENPRVALETSKGKIVLELYADKAPETVKNFLAYVDAGFYDGTIFHRVIPGFMIQGGGFTADMKQKRPQKPIRNEADNGLRFINTVDNDHLNHKSKSTQGWGYAVFGRVVEGMAVVDAISGVKTGTRDVPTEAVVITRAKRVK